MQKSQGQKKYFLVDKSFDDFYSRAEKGAI